MTLKEIEARKAELLNKITEAKTEEELAELRKEAENLKKEVPEEDKKEEKKDGTITHEEERNLLADVDNLEQRKVEITNVINPLIYVLAISLKNGDSSSISFKISIDTVSGINKPPLFTPSVPLAGAV